jgi:hypothetical protein
MLVHLPFGWLQTSFAFCSVQTSTILEGESEAEFANQRAWSRHPTQSPGPRCCS